MYAGRDIAQRRQANSMSSGRRLCRQTHEGAAIGVYHTSRCCCVTSITGVSQLEDLSIDRNHQRHSQLRGQIAQFPNCDSYAQERLQLHLLHVHKRSSRKSILFSTPTMQPLLALHRSLPSNYKDFQHGTSPSCSFCTTAGPSDVAAACKGPV